MCARHLHVCRTGTVSVLKYLSANRTTTLSKSLGRWQAFPWCLFIFSVTGLGGLEMNVGAREYVMGFCRTPLPCVELSQPHTNQGEQLNCCSSCSSGCCLLGLSLQQGQLQGEAGVLQIPLPSALRGFVHSLHAAAWQTGTWETRSNQLALASLHGTGVKSSATDIPFLPLCLAYILPCPHYFRRNNIFLIPSASKETLLKGFGMTLEK